MKVDLIKLFTGDLYFEVVSSKSVCSTSNNIANLFNLDVDKYNDLLINEVIKHSNYKTNRSVNSFVFNTSTIDIVFHLNDVPKEIYIERFKETFFNELTLLTLGGI